MPELITQLMALLSADEPEQKEVFPYTLLLFAATNDTLRPLSAPRENCARSLASVFWERLPISFERSHRLQIHKPEKVSACF